MTILHIDSSAQLEGSTTRALSAEIVAKLRGEVIRRDLAEALPLINHTWIGADFTPAISVSDRASVSVCTWSR